MLLKKLLLLIRLFFPRKDLICADYEHTMHLQIMDRQTQFNRHDPHRWPPKLVLAITWVALRLSRQQLKPKKRVNKGHLKQVRMSLNRQYSSVIFAWRRQRSLLWASVAICTAGLASTCGCDSLVILWSVLSVKAVSVQSQLSRFTRAITTKIQGKKLSKSKESSFSSF